MAEPAGPARARPDWRHAGDPARRRLAGLYGAGGAVCLAGSLLHGGPALLLAWPAASLALVAIAYAGAGPELFQKNRSGPVALGMRLLLWPYTIGARINAWAWLRGRDAASEIVPGLSVGAISTAPGGARVIDLCAEIPRGGARAPGRFLPMLDLVVPTPAELASAATAIEDERRKSSGGVLVCCALGYGRSAAVAATWLAAYGHAASVPAAASLVRARRPGAVLGAAHIAAIRAAAMRVRSDCAAPRFGRRLHNA